RDIGRDREWLLESFVVDVVLRAELSAVRELELRDVDVPPTALVIAVRFVVIAQARVWIPILQPLEIFVSDQPLQHELVVAEAACAREKSNFRIEVGANLNDARRMIPVGRGV